MVKNLVGQYQAKDRYPLIISLYILHTDVNDPICNNPYYKSNKEIGDIISIWDDKVKSISL